MDITVVSVGMSESDHFNVPANMLSGDKLMKQNRPVGKTSRIRVRPCELLLRPRSGSNLSLKNYDEALPNSTLLLIPEPPHHRCVVALVTVSSVSRGASSPVVTFSSEGTVRLFSHVFSFRLLEADAVTQRETEEAAESEMPDSTC